MSAFNRSTFTVHVGMAVVLAVSMAAVAPVHAGGFHGPRNTIPVDPLPQVEQVCGAVFAPSWTGPRPGRFEKVNDLGKCPVRQVVRWLGPRATIPVY